MPSRRRLLGLLALALVVLSAVAPAVARPPPEPLCGTCTMGQDADGVYGVGVDPANSSLTVELFANGSSRWTERVELTRGADELAANDTFRADLVEGALRWHAAEEHVDTQSRVESDTLVTTYRVPAVATRSAGVLTVDLFDRTDREAWVYVGAARATLVAPDGYHLVDGPAGERAETNASAVVWTDDAPADDYGPDVEGRISFAEDGTTAGGLRASLVTAQAEGPPLLLGAATVALVPTLLVAATGVLYVRSRATSGQAVLSRLTLGVTVAAAWLVGLATTAFTLLYGLLPDEPRVAPLVVVPLVALFAFGYCATAGDRTRRAIGGLALAPWVGVVVLVLNGQLVAGRWVAVLVIVVGAFAVTAVGVPGYLAGRRLAPAPSGED